jgi:hypothetical protein
MQPYISRKLDLSLYFSVYFLSCIAKGLAICKFRGVIRAECCTFKPLYSHMLIQHCYLFDLHCFSVSRSNARVPLEIGLKGTSWHHFVPGNDPVNDRTANDRPKLVNDRTTNDHPKLVNDRTANDRPNPVNVRTRACRTRKSPF